MTAEIYESMVRPKAKQLLSLIIPNRDWWEKPVQVAHLEKVNYFEFIHQVYWQEDDFVYCRIVIRDKDSEFPWLVGWATIMRECNRIYDELGRNT